MPTTNTKPYWIIVVAFLTVGLVLGTWSLFAPDLQMKSPHESGRTLFFSLDRPSVWGDFGALFINGQANRNRESNLMLYRTGPFLPPVSIPIPGFGTMVVSDHFRKKMEHSDLKGFSFVPVIKKHIVEFHWEDWDWQKEIPQLPEIEQLDDLIYKFPHSEAAAQAMGPIWEVRFDKRIELDVFNQRSAWDSDLKLAEPMGKLIGYDLALGRNRDRVNFAKIVVSQKAREWLEQNAGKWVQFKPIFTN